MKALKFHFITLGCPKNLVDTEKLISNFSKINFTIVLEPEKSDYVIINTCGFIKPALQETYSVIREILDLKISCKFKLIVMGCAVTRKKEEILKSFPLIDAIFSLKDEEKLIEYIKNSVNFNKNHNTHRNDSLSITLPHFAYLKIAEGCNRSCAFCTIPKIRGPYKSKPLEKVIEEAKNLAKRGVKELILIAQDTTYYGIDLYKKPTLLNLLKELVLIKKIKWIRVLYTYPDNFSDELLEFILNTPKIVNYLDLPIQHSHADILCLMGRANTFKKFDSIFKRVREVDSTFCLRTTVITGFPGEEEEHYNHLKDYIKRIKFDRLGVFEFYKEKGTASYNMKNQISSNIKKKRYNNLMTLQQEIHFKKNESLINSFQDVIIDKKLESNLYLGRSYRDAPSIDTYSYLDCSKKLIPGDIYKCKVIKSLDYDLLLRIK